MLSQKTIETISGFTSSLDKVNLVPMHGTPLSEIVYPMIDKAKVSLAIGAYKKIFDEYTEDDIYSFVHGISLRSESDDENRFDMHQELLDQAVDKVSEVISNNVHLARSVVLPLIDEYTEELNSLVNGSANAAALSITVVTDRTLDILSNPQLINVVADQVKRDVYNGINLPRYHAERTDEEILNLLVTGQKKFDEQIHTWIQSDNNVLEAVKSCYRKFFLKASNGNKILVSDYINVDTPTESIITMLLCWGLVKGTPDDDIPVSYEDYKNIMGEVSSVAASFIAKAIEKQKANYKSKKLVIKYPLSNRQYVFDEPHKNQILVNGALYEEFLKAGGTPEHLIGSYLSDRKVYSDEIIESGEKFAKFYNRAVVQSRLTKANNTIAIVQEYFRNLTFKLPEDVANIELGDSGKKVNIEGTVYLEKAKRFTRGISAKQCENLYTLVRDFLCECFFDETMVLEFLTRIEIIDPEGNQDINDVAVIASTDLIVDWLLSQLNTNTSFVENFY